MNATTPQPPPVIAPVKDGSGPMLILRSKPMQSATQSVSNIGIPLTGFWALMSIVETLRARLSLPINHIAPIGEFRDGMIIIYCGALRAGHVIAESLKTLSALLAQDFFTIHLYSDAEECFLLQYSGAMADSAGLITIEAVLDALAQYGRDNENRMAQMAEYQANLAEEIKNIERAIAQNEAELRRLQNLPGADQQ